MTMDTDKDIHNLQEDPRNSRPTRLRNFLENDPEGRMIVEVYDEKNSFNANTNLRDLLVRLMIRREKQSLIQNLKPNEKLDKFLISSTRFESLAAEIVETFPTESTAVYYTPFVSNQGQGQNINANGKLWNHYNYTKKPMKGNCLLKAVSKQSSSISQEDFRVDGIESKNVITLQTLVEPWFDVVTLWNDTFNERLGMLKDPSLTVEKYYSKFACLSMQNAIDLFECDFKHLHPAVHNAFPQKWPQIKRYLFNKLQSSKINDLRDISWLQLAVNLPPDQQDAVLFYLLPYLIPNARQGRKRKLDTDDKTPRKLTIHERREAFFIIVESEETIETALSSAKKTIKKIQLNHHPMPVLVGTLNNITSTYVIVNDVTYEISSIQKAIDLAFKICYSLNCKYPTDSYSLWLFLQKVMYNISNADDKISIPLRTLIGDIKNIVS